VSKKQVNDNEIMNISKEIKNYLMAHPNAVDSLEGIAKWWLTRQQYEQAVVKVKKSLDLLVAKGVISKRRITGGKVVYASTQQDNGKDNSS